MLTRLWYHWKDLKERLKYDVHLHICIRWTMAKATRARRDVPTQPRQGCRVVSSREKRVCDFRDPSSDGLFDIFLELAPHQTWLSSSFSSEVLVPTCFKFAAVVRPVTKNHHHADSLLLGWKSSILASEMCHMRKPSPCVSASYFGHSRTGARNSRQSLAFK